jgi:hypothetical protein
VLEQLSGSTITAPDPLAETLRQRQPDARFDAYLSTLIDEMALAARPDGLSGSGG